MREHNGFALVGALLLSPLLACVSKGQYDAAVADAQGAHAKLAGASKHPRPRRPTSDGSSPMRSNNPRIWIRR
jgi:outer membrane lipoprotein-sorting protein